MLDPRKIRRTLSRLVAFLLVSVLAGALSVVVLASPVVLATALVQDATTGFADLPSVLTAPALFQTSTMLAADGTRIASFYSENRTVVQLSQMSLRVRQAIVAIEDARFYEHGAVDPRGLLRAAVNDVTGGGTQGASTLTQQYVKNLLLQQAQASGDAGAVEAATAPTIARKLREVRLAIGLEQQLTKDEILAGYLNIVYFGEDAYGIEAASERYFGVHASRLTLPQAALLAGIVQEPVADDPLVHPTAAKARRDVVLKAMHDENMITAGEYAAAVRSRVRITGHPYRTVARRRAGRASSARRWSARSRPTPSSRHWARRRPTGSRRSPGEGWSSGPRSTPPLRRRPSRPSTRRSRNATGAGSPRPR